MALVISHKQIKRIGVLGLLPEQEVNVMQGGWSSVNIVAQKDQLIARLEIPVDNLLRGFEITMSIANKNDFA